MDLVRKPDLIELQLADDPDAWRALGFKLDENDNLDLGGVRLRFGAHGGGIVAWSFDLIGVRCEIDGLSTPPPSLRLPPPFHTHPNGATGLDHLVVATNNFDRSALALDAVGLTLTREDETDFGRAGFRRIGPAILELVQREEEPATRFWGLGIVVISLESLAERLGELLGPIRPAVQAGRKIATLDSAAAGIKTPVVFMSPEPP